MEIGLTLTIDDFEDLSPDEQRDLYVDELWVLTKANEAWLRRHPECPRILDSGVRFYISEAEMNGVGNRGRNIPGIRKEKRAHCIGLTCWRVAELRVRDGIDATPAVHEYITPRPVGLVQHFHALVAFPDGSEEDISKLLGMPSFPT